MTGKPEDVVVTNAMINAAYKVAMKMVHDGGYGWEVSLIPDVESKLKAALAAGYRIMAALDPNHGVPPAPIPAPAQPAPDAPTT